MATSLCYIAVSWPWPRPRPRPWPRPLSGSCAQVHGLIGAICLEAMPEVLKLGLKVWRLGLAVLRQGFEIWLADFQGFGANVLGVF